MKCRFCGQPLKKDEKICPKCQKKVANSTQLILVAVVAAIALIGLLIVLINAMDLEFLKEKKDKKEETKPVTTQTVEKYESDIDYTLDEAACAAAANDVVATVNGVELTNRVFQLYYNWEVSNFISANQSYLTSMGLDYTRPLNEQKCYYDDISWEVYFVRSAINTWQQYQAVYAMAVEEGFVLSAENQEALDSMPADLEAAAKADGNDDVNAWLQEKMMSDITVEDYVEYTKLIAYYVEYVSVDPTNAELEQYYSENEEYFQNYGLGKDAGPIVNVRHILLQPEANEETGEISEEAWATCKSEAEDLLKEWKNGDATEESFASMAMLYSSDGGSASNGGLYEEITAQTSFVEPFLKWCIDDSRKVGDTDIVKTDYGYHIMYFSSGDQLWRMYAETWYSQEQELSTVDKAIEKFTVESFLDKVVIQEFDLT